MKEFNGQPHPRNAIARCTNRKHAGLLSLNNIKNHKCEAKQCRYFIPLTDHPYWKEKEKKKTEKRIKKIQETIKYADDETIAEMIARLIMKGVEE